jgi:glycolate oxidase FAD binding subunit
MSDDSLRIDDVGPMPVERPASVAELCDVVRRCATDGTAIYPVGGGTLLDYGTPPARPGVALSTAKLDQVIDFPARDMTITVQAGITMARLHEITKAERLWLPIDVPVPEMATLGGSIAANVSGPRRYGYGTFRDYVIGITLVNDRGEETKAGGRVVKNVAGYDLMKLYTGSLGTLGVITQVTLKLKPVPEREAFLVTGCSPGQLRSAFDLLHATKTSPTSLQAFGTGAGKQWVLWVGFDGNAEAVAWQTREVAGELRSQGLQTADEHEGVPSQLLPEGVKEFRASLLPSKVVDFIYQSGQADKGAMIQAQFGSGTVQVRLHSGRSQEEVRKTSAALLAAATECQGNLVVRRCPAAWKSDVRVWGRPPSDLALQKAVKHSLDPNGIFNPGRFVTDAL